MGDLLDRARQLQTVWAAGLARQKEILDNLKPNDERIAFRREQLMMEGYDQIQAESLARNEFVEDEMKATTKDLDKIIDAAVDATKQGAGLPAGHRFGHNHPDPSCFVPSCTPCLVRQAREKHKKHIDAAPGKDDSCSICIESGAGMMSTEETNRLEQLLAKKAAGEKLHKREKKRLRVLSDKAGITKKKDEPPNHQTANAPKAAKSTSTAMVLVKKQFSAQTWWPFEMERLHAALGIVAAVNDVAFVAPAVADLRKFMDTRLGDLFEMSGLNRDGTGGKTIAEMPRCPTGFNCLKARYHDGECRLRPEKDRVASSPLAVTDSTSVAQASRIVDARGKLVGHADDCACEGCLWWEGEKAKEAVKNASGITWCTVHTAGCSMNSSSCRLTKATGTSVVSPVMTPKPADMVMCDNQFCKLNRGHRLAVPPILTCKLFEAAKEKDNIVSLVQAVRDRRKDNVTVVEHYEKRQVVSRYEIEDFEVDDERTFRFKCVKSPAANGAIDTTKLDHMWYAKLDDKAFCPQCKGRPLLLHAKPLTEEQELAYQRGMQGMKEPNNAPST